MGDFSLLEQYLDSVVNYVRKDKTLNICLNLALVGRTELQPDIDRVLEMSSGGEAGAVLDDITRVIYEHLYDFTRELGIAWEENHTYDDLFDMADTLDALLLTNGTDDTGDIKAILNGEGSDETKFIDIISYALNKDVNHLLEIIHHIEPGILEGIREAITTTDTSETEDVLTDIPAFVKPRLENAVLTMHRGLAYTYIMNGGALGCDIDSLLKFYEEELTSIQAQAILIEEIKGFLLSSETPDNELNSELVRLINVWVTDEAVLLNAHRQTEGFGA